jgi:RecJ-like exonuclease
VRYSGGKREYTITDGNTSTVLQSNVFLSHGNIVVVEGENVIILEGKEAKEGLEEIKKNIKSQAKIAGPNLVKDELIEKMWPMLSNAAAELICAKKIGRSVFLRFHGDADGISGAFAITEIVRCKSFQQNSAIYNVRDALRDIGNLGQESMPLIILLDFGSNDDSKDALDLLKAAGIEYMIIDHHPPGKNPPEMISPFLFTDNGSRYTAGYLACEIAAACGNDTKELARIACSGDKSNIIANDAEDAKKAKVLDYLAAHVSFGNNLEFYRKVMLQDELFRSIALQAEEAIEEAAARVKKKETTEGKLKIVTLALENVVKKGEWPPSGKITTKIFEEMSGEEPLLVIGHNDRSIIMRLNEAAEKIGLSANSLAKKIIEIMPDFVEGGGGHIRAGAIRVRQGFVRDVLSELIRQANDVSKDRQE